MSLLRRGRRPLAGLTAVTVAGLVLSACSSGHVSSAARAPKVPGQTTGGPDLAGVSLPNFIMPAVHGQVSRPRASLTPGAVTTTDTNKVCALSPHASAPAVPASTQDAVLAAYGYASAPTSASASASAPAPAPGQSNYVIDYLVPYNLGGATTQANLWPASIKGTGFSQKVQTDDILHQLVCRRSITLVQAQHALETDWYAAWLRYVVAGGHT